MKRKFSAVLAAVMMTAAAGATGAVMMGSATAGAATTATAARTATGPGGSWKPAVVIHGMPGISGLACTSPGDCVAVGGADIVTERNGVWGAPRTVPGLNALGSALARTAAASAVSCASAGNCAAGGRVGGSSSGGYAWGVTEKKGTWGDVRLIAGSQGGGISAISCVPRGDCTAVGTASQGHPEVGLAAREHGGVWGSAQLIKAPAGLYSIPYFFLQSVSCTANGACTAAGGVSNAEPGGFEQHRAVIVDETHGHWNLASVLPGLPTGTGGSGSTVLVHNDAGPLSCRTPGDCTVAGDYEVDVNSKQTAAGAYFATKSNGIWRKPALLSVTGLINFSASSACATARNCSLVLQSVTTDLTAQEVNGRFAGKAVALPGLAALNTAHNSLNLPPVISCAASGYCAVGGMYSTASPAGSSAFVAVKTAAGWRHVQRVRGLPPHALSAHITQMSCTATGSCTAAGVYQTASDPGGGFVVNEVAASNTTLGLSRGWVGIRQEKTEHLKVTVKSAWGTPAGTVTVRAGRAILCRIALKGGHGACVLRASQLKPGTYKVTAAYSGSALYLSSASAAKSLTIKR